MYTFACVLCVGIPRNVLTVSVFPLTWAVIPFGFRSNYSGLRWFGVLARTFMYLCLCVWLHVYTHHRLSLLLYHTTHLGERTRTTISLTKFWAVCVSVCISPTVPLQYVVRPPVTMALVCHAHCRHGSEIWPPLSECLFHMFIFTVENASFLPSFLLLPSVIVCSIEWHGWVQWDGDKDTIKCMHMAHTHKDLVPLWYKQMQLWCVYMTCCVCAVHVHEYFAYSVSDAALVGSYCYRLAHTPGSCPCQ